MRDGYFMGTLVINYVSAIANLIQDPWIPDCVRNDFFM